MLQELMSLVIKLGFCAQVAPVDVILVGVAPVPFVALMSKMLLDFRSRREEQSRRVAEASTTITSDVISNMKTVRGFAMEHGETQTGLSLPTWCRLQVRMNQ